MACMPPRSWNWRPRVRDASSPSIAAPAVSTSRAAVPPGCGWSSPTTTWRSHPGGSPPQLAPADALVNPKLPGSTYAFDGLAGAGVAFKLVEALESRGVVPAGSAEASLGLAALGTIADMMPLRGENRVIVRDGLPRMADLPGLRALCDVAGISLPPRGTDIAFAVGPRINAAGRMEDARLALELCLCDDPDEATRSAVDLDIQNRLRQQAVAVALAQAEEQVAGIDEAAAAIVLGDPGWPMGIVGLVAGRLAERYARPTFIACLDPDEAKGSARSAGGVHIVKALDGAATSLLRYGGHAAAAGFSLDAARFDEFRELITASVGEQNADVGAHTRLHHRLRDLRDRCDPRALPGAGPARAERPGESRAASRGLRQPVLGTSTFGSKNQHIRVTLATGSGIVEAIAFFKPNLADHLPRGRLVDACFGLEVDSFQGFQRVRARLRDPASRSCSGAERSGGRPDGDVAGNDFLKRETSSPDPLSSVLRRRRSGVPAG